MIDSGDAQPLLLLQTLSTILQSHEVNWLLLRCAKGPMHVYATPDGHSVAGPCKVILTAQCTSCMMSVLTYVLGLGGVK